MTTIDTNKSIQKQHTEEEMNTALQLLIDNKHTLHVPPQIEDADMVLGDAIRELLNRRQQIDPDTAITAFMGWLTSRDEVAGPFSGYHEAGQAVELMKAFCEAQGWEDAPSERFERQIKLLKTGYPKSTISLEESEKRYEEFKARIGNPVQLLATEDQGE